MPADSPWTAILPLRASLAATSPTAHSSTTVFMLSATDPGAVSFISGLLRWKLTVANDGHQQQSENRPVSEGPEFNAAAGPFDFLL